MQTIYISSLNYYYDWCSFFIIKTSIFFHPVKRVKGMSGYDVDNIYYVDEDNEETINLNASY